MKKLERDALLLVLKHIEQTISTGYALGDEKGREECMRLMESPDYKAGLETVKNVARQYLNWVLDANTSELNRFVKSKGTYARNDEHMPPKPQKKKNRKEARR